MNAIFEIEKKSGKTQLIIHLQVGGSLGLWLGLGMLQVIV